MCSKGNLRSEVALSGLATFESKFQRIKDERDNVARAREALELPDTGEYKSCSFCIHSYLTTDVVVFF